MGPNLKISNDWGQYPALDEVAERGSASAFPSGVLLAGLILTLATANLLVCNFDQPITRELVVNVDQVSALVWPRSTDHAPRQKG